MWTRICRFVSSTCVALAASAVVLLVSSALYERFDLQDRWGIDDDICWLTVVVGPVFMTIFHRRFHASRWLPTATSLVGAIGLVAAIVVFARMSEAADAHEPTGPFPGLGYAIIMVLSVITGAACVLAVVGGLLGMVAYRVNKTADSVVRVDGEDAAT